MMKSLTHCHILFLAIAFAALVGASGCEGSDAQDTVVAGSETGTSSDGDTDSDSDTASPVCPVPIEIRKSDVLTILQEGADPCYPRRLEWDPQSQTTMCRLVVELEYDQTEYPTAPACPIDNGEQWEDDDDSLIEMSRISDGETQRFWIRRCTIPQLPAPINCGDMADDQYSDDDETLFGWYYCETPSEDSAVACADGLDNDGDTKIDGADPDCEKCLDESDCSSQCLYTVALSASARIAALSVGSATMECLTAYRVEVNSCSLTDTQ
ncbi:MAG: hypothetical protein JXX14_09115 [Deltaproteobacteria bacterium]|nr:hypothetical protein [Deltaproteobacteria bacterium]